MRPDNKTLASQVFFKLGDIAALLDIEEYVLRYWRTKFPEIEPIKLNQNRNLYTAEHLERFRELKRLLYDERYTLAGARKYLDKTDPGPTGAEAAAPGPPRAPAPKPPAPVPKAPKAAAPAPDPQPEAPAGAGLKKEFIQELSQELREIREILSRPLERGDPVPPPPKGPITPR
ncbi:MAG: MerR family transcriptional regulator [Deltaproteobacteria bacterium]|jgi:DNA-binding transcriptional MerR regulator|nr:MerR family transcriptional regulator [Deltaproteobacteria bacterium]